MKFVKNLHEICKKNLQKICRKFVQKLNKICIKFNYNVDSEFAGLSSKSSQFGEDGRTAELRFLDELHFAFQGSG